MQFFFSAEIDTLATDAWLMVGPPLARRLNAALADRDYGPAVRRFALIPMIFRPEWQHGRRERRLWKRREATADYRTWIDFHAFTTATPRERERLLIDNLLAAVHDVSRKAGTGLDGDTLAADILAVSVSSAA